MQRDDLITTDAWVQSWANWFRADHKEIEAMVGYPTKSAGFWSGGSSSADSFDEMVEAEDLKCVLLVDRCVRDLDGQHYAAICNHYLAAVWRHRGEPKTILEESLCRIREQAKKLGVPL